MCSLQPVSAQRSACVCVSVCAWGLRLLYEPCVSTDVCISVCVCVCVCVCRESSTVPSSTRLPSNWPPEGQSAGRRLTNWSPRRPFSASTSNAPRDRWYLSTFTVPPSIHPLILPSFYSSPSSWEATLIWQPPSWCPSFPFLSQVSYLLISYPPPPPSTICLCSTFSPICPPITTPRTLLKCLLDVCYFCRVWRGRIW